MVAKKLHIRDVSIALSLRHIRVRRNDSAACNNEEDEEFLRNQQKRQGKPCTLTGQSLSPPSNPLFDFNLGDLLRSFLRLG